MLIVYLGIVCKAQVKIARHAQVFDHFNVLQDFLILRLYLRLCLKTKINDRKTFNK